MVGITKLSVAVTWFLSKYAKPAGLEKMVDALSASAAAALAVLCAVTDCVPKW